VGSAERWDPWVWRWGSRMVDDVLLCALRGKVGVGG
jgi:hypothetical protein